MKKIFTLSMALCLAVVGYSQEINIREFTANRLQSFLNELPSSVLEGHGFNNKGEFARAKVGSIYQVMTLEKDGSLKPNGNYDVILTVDGQNRTIVSVGTIDNKLDIYGIGYASLSNEIGSLEKSYRKSDSSLNKLRVNDLTNNYSYLSFSNNLNDADLMPLGQTKAFLQQQTGRSKSTYKASDLAKLMN